MNYFNFSLSVFLLAASCCNARICSTESDCSKFHWEKISEEKVPALTQEKLHEFSGKNAFESILVKSLKEINLYRGVWVQDNAKHYVSVTEKGTLINKGSSISLENVPENIQKAAKNSFPAGSELSFNKETRISYEAVLKGRKDRFLDRNSIKDLIPTPKRNPIALDSIPALALQSLQNYSGDAVIDQAFSRQRGDFTVYGIQWTEQDKKHSAWVLEDGTFLKSIEFVNADLVPKYMQKATKGEDLEFKKELSSVYHVISKSNSEDQKRNHLFFTPLGNQVHFHKKSN